MSVKTLLLSATLFTLLSLNVSAKPITLDMLEGSWHLRVLDGGEVRKARAILKFNAKTMILEGFDGCNRITGDILKNPEALYEVHPMSTRMACREPIHRYVSKRLHTLLAEGFNIIEEKRYGVEGITLQSLQHNLFFKRMKRE